MPPAQPYAQQPYTPAPTQQPDYALQQNNYAAAPDYNVRGSTGPNYQISAPPPAIDLVTVILGVIAFLAVVGLIPLWLAVLNAYARG